MTYYKIKGVYDNIALYNRVNNAYYSILVGGELFTVKEWAKLTAKYKTLSRYYPIENAYTTVDIPKNQTYFFFGVRRAD